MPIYHQFKDRKTNEMVNLDEVDRLMAEASGFPYSPTDYCPAYMRINWLGMGILTRQGGSEITDESFDAYRAYRPDTLDSDEEWAIARRFLVTDYEYFAWYSVVK